MVKAVISMTVGMVICSTAFLWAMAEEVRVMDGGVAQDCVSPIHEHNSAIIPNGICITR